MMGRPTKSQVVAAACAWGICAAALAGASTPSASPASAAAASVSDSRRLDLDGDRAAARAELVKQLETLAEWCSTKKIYLQRQGVFESILHFDPENVLALRGLGYVKDKDGNWKETERKVVAKDWSPAAVREFPEKRAEVVETYRATMFGLLESYAKSLSPAQREQILDDILYADPDEARVHELRGEAKLEDAWVLKQTVAAKERREALKHMVREAFKSAPEPVVSAALPKEEAFGIVWKAIYATPIVRSLGTGSEQEVSRMTQAMAATRSYFSAALGAEATFPKDFTVYTLARPADKMAFLMNHPAIDQTYRDFLFKIEGSGIQGSSDLAQWSEDPLRRLDGLVRQGIMWLFAATYQIFPKHGWVFEGFGLYMTRELVGTRLTWFVKPSEYLIESDDMALQARLLDTRTNWMNEANKVLEKPDRPKLALLLGKDVNQLRTEDLLYSYVLAAYLMEAEFDKLSTILSRMGKGEASVTVLEDVFHLTLVQFEERVLRWLRERR